MNNLTPATAQDVEEAKILISVKKSEKILGIGSKPYDIPELLKHFKILTEVKIENDETQDLLLVTDAKNILLRPQILKQIEINGKFDLSGQIPFENSCISCRGTGELYRFFRKTIPETCRYCEGGVKTIKSKTNDTRTVRCKKCRGSSVFMKIVIDHYIKSTTYCKVCKGRGFILPESEKKIQNKSKKQWIPNNPVITKDLGSKIKNM